MEIDGYGWIFYKIRRDGWIWMNILQKLGEMD